MSKRVISEHISDLHLEGITIGFLCKHFCISRSRYYQIKNETKRLTTSKELKKIEIQSIFNESKGTYGSPRVHAEMLRRGFSINVKTVAQYMCEMGLCARKKARFKVMTTDSNHKNKVSDRLFKVEEALPNEPNKIWAGDITYITVAGGFVYLSVILDLFNREVIGWALHDTLEASGPTKALTMALNKNEDVKEDEIDLIFHSDRGVQYSSGEFRFVLDAHSIHQSMSRRGNCYDNAYVESFFKTLKEEMVYKLTNTNREHVKNKVFEYIEGWYNKKRLHSSLGYNTPIEYRENYNNNLTGLAA